MPWHGYELEVRNVDVGYGDWVTRAAIFVRKKKSPLYAYFFASINSTKEDIDYSGCLAL